MRLAIPKGLCEIIFSGPQRGNTVEPNTINTRSMGGARSNDKMAMLWMNDPHRNTHLLYQTSNRLTLNPNT